MLPRLILRGVLASAIVLLGALIAVRQVAPEQLHALSPDLVPVRQQVASLLEATAEDRERGVISDTTLERGRNLALAHPLDPLPYTLVQFDSMDRGNDEAANRAALIALSLQPRNRAARMHLVNELLARDAYDVALEHITTLTRVDPNGLEHYTAAIVNLTREPAAWAAIERAVAMDPAWKVPVLTALSETEIDEAFLQRLFGHWPEGTEILLSRLVRHGKLDTAYLAFLTTLDGEAEISVPYDDMFEGAAGPLPFNWDINDRYAELSETGGLDISYFGQAEARLARQIIPLSPGAYQLITRFEGAPPGEASKFGVRLACMVGDGSEPELARWSFTDASIRSGVSKDMFSHEDASGCAYVALELVAAPGAYPATSQFKILGVTVGLAELDG